MTGLRLPAVERELASEIVKAIKDKRGFTLTLHGIDGQILSGEITRKIHVRGGHGNGPARGR